MSLAGALMIGVHFPGSDDTVIVPLLAEAARFSDLWGLWALKIALILGYVTWGLKPAVLAFGAFTTAIAWLAFYSSTGAFVPQVILNCLFMAIIMRSEVSHLAARSLAIFFTSIIFLVAGFQKINSLYFSGLEFLSPAGFGAYYVHFFGPLPSTLARDVFPTLSIAIEFGIGVGVLLRPNLFANLATIFILLLMYIHPTLALPYLTFAATAVIIDPTLATSLQKRLGKIPITSAFTWLVVLAAFQGLRKIGDKSALEFFWFPAAFATTFLAFHISHIASTLKSHDWYTPSPNLIELFRSMTKQPNRSGAWLLCAMVLSPIFHAIGAPSPIGFSMFSANTSTLNSSRASKMPSLTTSESSVCEALGKKLIRLIVTDVTLYQRPSGCKLIAPTQSGLRYTKEQLCEMHRDSCQFIFINDQASPANEPSRPETLE